MASERLPSITQAFSHGHALIMGVSRKGRANLAGKVSMTKRIFSLFFTRILQSKEKYNLLLT